MTNVRKSPRSKDEREFRLTVTGLCEPEARAKLSRQLCEDWKVAHGLGLDAEVGKRISKNECALAHFHGIRKGMAWAWELANRNVTEPRETILEMLARSPRLTTQQLCTRLDSLNKADIKPWTIKSWRSFVGPQTSWTAALTLERNNVEVYFSRIRDMAARLRMLQGWQKLFRKYEKTT